MLAELLAAFMLLTRLPVGRFGQTCTNDVLARAVWAYPIAGAAIGAIGAAAYMVSAEIGLPSSFSAVCALATTILATGALHEDGLADMADGFGGGRSREHKLEIMRDSRIGTFGVLALALTLAARGSALASIAMPGKAALALIASSVVARGAMLVPLLVLIPARPDGLGARLRGTTRTRALIGIVLSAVPPLLWLSPAIAAGAIVISIAVALCLCAIALRQIGGYTGDVLGGTEVVAECLVLGLLAATASISTR